MTKRLNEPIASWQPGDQVQGFALLRQRDVRQDRNGRDYLDLLLADASGNVKAKVWSGSPALAQEFAAGEYVAFSGSVESYRDQPQLRIDNCRRAVEADRAHGFDEGRLVPTTREDLDDLWRRLETLYGERVERPPLRALAAAALAKWGAELREHPAAKLMHHAYRGGLLEHVVSMGELALAVAGHYRELDRDLLLLGVLFHDLGKLRELGAMPDNDYTLAGRLVGHVVMGRDMVREAAVEVPGLTVADQLHLEHLVLSHQGRKEFASPVEPATPEALALHFIDDLDSKLAQLRAVRETTTGIVYHRGLDRHVYLAPDED